MWGSDQNWTESELAHTGSSFLGESSVFTKVNTFSTTQRSFECFVLVTNQKILLTLCVCSKFYDPVLSTKTVEKNTDRLVTKILQTIAGHLPRICWTDWAERWKNFGQNKCNRATQFLRIDRRFTYRCQHFSRASIKSELLLLKINRLLLCPTPILKISKVLRKTPVNFLVFFYPPATFSFWINISKNSVVNFSGRFIQ